MVAMFELDALLVEAKPKADKVLADVCQFVLESFDKFDLNNDGFLSREEIEIALRAPDRTVKQAAFLQFLLVRMNEIAAAVDDDPNSAEAAESGISSLDLRTYFAHLLEKQD